MSPQSCPICNRQQVSPLLETARITAIIDGDSRNVHGLVAFICEMEGHIFFVRASDLENAQMRQTVPLEGGTSL